MLFGKIIVVITVFSLTTAFEDFDETESSLLPSEGDDSEEITKINIDDEMRDFLKNGKDSNEEILRSKADLEADIKAWIHHLDCLKTPMGALKCLMIKKATENFNKNTKREYSRLKERFKFFIIDLKENGQVDKDLELLLKKYGKFLNK